VSGRGDALDDLHRAFQLLGSLQRSFEATETKHRLRRAGFEPTPHELRTPFVPNSFFGEIVLTLWLLIRGATPTPPPLPHRALESQAG